MSKQARGRRKKTFKVSNESNESSTMTIVNIKQEEDTSLVNVRRSSRKPKPKKYGDEDDMISEEPTLGPATEEAFPMVENLHASDYDVPPEAKGRRETRKTYQNYLETLGYNTDFSKIATDLSNAHVTKVKHRKMESKANETTTAKQLVHDGKIESDLQSVEKNISGKVRASSRTPKPKRTFSLIEDEVANYLKVHSDKSPIVEQKPQRHPVPSVTEYTVSATIPLSKHDIDVFSSGEDNSQTRTSRRVRVPKRKFSLLEESPPDETNIQRVTYPEQTEEVERANTNNNEENDTTHEQSQSTLVIKRSNAKRQRGNRTQESIVNIKKEKVDDEERDISSRKNHPEPDKMITIKKEKPDFEETTLPKETPEHHNQESVHKKRRRKSAKPKKVVRNTSDLDKTGSDDDEMNIANKEHIVLKLTIPHNIPATEEKVNEKHHRKHHQHKYKKDKKERESNENKKKRKPENEDGGGSVKQTGSEDSGKLAISEVKTKKRKRKKSSKEEISELSSDTSTVPHVKVVIKKTPVKAKGAKTTSNVAAKPSTSEGNNQNDQNWLPNNASQKKKKSQLQVGSKSSKKKQKLLVSLGKKGKKKKMLKGEIHIKAVSAYSLFTKARRKGLLEMEPGLDFATTSRRLADMWNELSADDKEYWRVKAELMRKPKNARKVRQEKINGSPTLDFDQVNSSGTDAVDMAAYLKLLGESLCSIGMCLKQQDQMEVHGSLSVLLDTALCSIVPLFCLTSQLPEMAGCSSEVQAQILDNLAYIIPGL